MTQNEILAFLAVIEYGSISDAAHKLYIGQPTLSARIQSLENELNATLFYRSRGQKNTELTQAGRNFEPYAHKWLALWKESKTCVNANSNSQLTIAASLNIHAYILPDVYTHLPETTRSVSLRLRSEHSSEIYRLLESGDIDVGFVSNLQYSKNLTAYALYREEMVLICNQITPYPSLIDPSMLDVHNELYLGWNHEFHNWHNFWFGYKNDAAVYTNGATFAQHFISIPGNWCIVPISMANTLLRYHDIRICHLTHRPPDKVSSLICKESIDYYPALSDILDSMAEVVTNLHGEWIFHP